MTTKHEALNGNHKLNVEPVAHERALATTEGLQQPTFTQLVKAFYARGKDGILESACHLSDGDFAKLAAVVA
jgi:hypothetical protein